MLRRRNPPTTLNRAQSYGGLDVSPESPVLPGGGVNTAVSEAGVAADTSPPTSVSAPADMFDFSTLAEPKGESTVANTSTTASPLDDGRFKPPKVWARPEEVGPPRQFVTPPTAEEWERYRQVQALNEEIARRRAASEAQQAALAQARDERDQWRAASNHLEAKSAENRRIWWGVAFAVGAGALNYFWSSSKSKEAS